jgi:predicted transcriptional regulator
MTDNGDTTIPKQDNETASTRQSAAEFVAAYLRNNVLPADQVPALIRSVYASLSAIGKGTEPVAEKVPAVPIRRSVHPKYVVCLECGIRGQILRRHITSAHGLTISEYRAKWGLPLQYPLTAPNYSKHRSALAKKFRLGRLMSDREPPKSPTTPKRAARRRPAASGHAGSN